MSAARRRMSRGCSACMRACVACRADGTIRTALTETLVRSSAELRRAFNPNQSRLFHLVIHRFQISHSSSRNSQPSRSSGNGQVRRKHRRKNRPSSSYDDRADRSGWSNRRMETGSRSSYIRRHCDKAVPAAGLPHPTHTGNHRPVSVAVRHPTPGISGDERVAHAGIPRPGSIHEGIPSGAGKKRLPHHAVARNRSERPEIIEVTNAVAVG